MKKNFIRILILATCLPVAIVSCEKSREGSRGSEATPAILFKNDAQRDKNSELLSRMILNDPRWKALVHLYREFLDIIVSSNNPLDNYSEILSNSGFGILNSADYRIKLANAKLYAGKLMGKYFSNTRQCQSCNEITEKKWKWFAQKVSTFRRDEAKYRQFLEKIELSTESVTDKRGRSGSEKLPNCNNWRFSLCAAGCVLTAPTGPFFAACIALCVAEFCE